ncbi:carbonic anhydrase family protein [Xanthobacter autotrophicus]|uniref:carbonic anhydrase n=1 Tax=Xanthobacter TaxID=279 RepID=UPI0024AAFB09|nr:carbonic anhydrase family protein [Xanthobacter autotrophicus]MDI4665477.1 carbonic anhydrase family protein [Xanthobacter autotrophicus]
MAVTRRTLLAGLVSCPVCAGAAHAAGAHWTYEGHGGPQEWGSLESGFQACAVGSQQSPINLEGAVQAAGEGPTLAWKPNAFKIVNNGHTIQADVVGDAGTATMGGKTYSLRQFHFHAPSEHALNGERTAMEAHFVHDAPDGNLLVVGLFMKAGKANAGFAEVMKTAPVSAGATPLKAPLDPSVFLPAERATYRYEGSLTTPPCSEVVDWNVFATPIEVSEADIAAFRAIFPMNARPLQAVNRRFLLRLN